MDSAEAAQRELVRAWYDWRHTDLPVEHFRQNRVDSPRYAVEFILDHLRSYVYGLGSDFFESRRGDYAERIANHLERLHEAEIALADAGLAPEQATAYREFTGVTRRLLHALLRCTSATPQA